MNKIAIIIPYYKIDFFEETLRSVAAQTNKNFTLYIGNDASPDHPLPLIDKYFKKEDYQYFDYKENLGGKNLALQWERVLDNVKEDWFQILGDDDVISENFVEEFYINLNKIEKNNINVIKFSQALIDGQGVILTPYTHLKTITDYRDIWTDIFSKRERSSLSENIFRTSEYNKYKFKKYPLAWYSDDMAILEISNFKNIFFIETAQVQVRISEKSISGMTDDEVYNKKKEWARLYFYEDILKKFKLLPKKDIEPLLKFYLSICWNLRENKIINLVPLYFHIGKPLKILTIPYKKFLLNRNK
ncbi:glycosyltransferase family 2 protein [Kaistella carnis]|uniref:glycosyltransferase family 2 protein n=1 Tax=Kaistella carnis TaxID=1241979 RepID=UPI0028AEF37B|nr:glycosyltransferase family 2 protein [Kaistella carnis]